MRIVEKSDEDIYKSIRKHKDEMIFTEGKLLTDGEGADYDSISKVTICTDKYEVTFLYDDRIVACVAYNKNTDKTIYPQTFREFEAKVFEKSENIEINKTQKDDYKDKHMKVCEKLNKIYKQKNHDYGNSFSETYNELGLISCITRMNDKMNRLKQLTKNGKNEVKDESISDTLLDLANYSIMTYMCLQNNEKGSK